ncbi:unnamed protein product [Cladocopium goreaui]|uniref:Cathepsin E n=1 Tax=Cladocopium goreaui TaxID=2562237 RepID=A0A9P1FR33_9DINO|nr:unnamed protein product [Cladocopium goreaui]
MKNNLRCVQWRESVLHTQTVEGVFRKHMQAVVDPLFKTFAEGRPFLTPEEWFRMLDCMEIFPCSGTELDSDAQQMNAWDRVGRADFGIVSAGLVGRIRGQCGFHPKL